MKVKKIYEDGQGKSLEVIYQLNNDLKIIKRNKQSTKNFKLAKWEELNFIPDDFSQVKRDLSLKEKKELEAYINKKKNKSFITKLKNFLKF